MSSEHNPVLGRRINLDTLEVGPPAPATDITDYHLKNALTSTCVALQFAASRRQAMTLWHALRSLLEAKFPGEDGQ